MDDATLVNPFNLDGFAAGIRAALAMSPDERRRRMRRLRAQLRRSTIYDWIESILAGAAAIIDAQDDLPAADRRAEDTDVYPPEGAL